MYPIEWCGSSTMSNLVRFDCYEVDLSAGQLYKHGVRVNIRDKSFRVLVSLLKHSGQVVTREDLHRQLWRGDVFVDFDNNLNTAIARLREALCDSADHPRFIETLPRRGYRFLGSVSEPPESFARRKTRVVVLPFINLTGDQDQEYFSDAITDEIITALAVQAPEDVAVIARTTAMQYKDSHKTVSSIGRELDADYVVEGGVRRAKGQISINVQVIQVSDEIHVFAKKYESQVEDIFGMQSSIAEAIMAHIDLPTMADPVRTVSGHVPSLLPKERQKLMATHRVDPEVYDTTVRARMMLEYAIREHQVRQAITLFQSAIDLDPTYAPAWAGLGEGLWYLATTGLEFVAPTDVREKAIAAAERALQLDDTLADAHKARAVIALDAEWDVARAQLLFEQVLKLRPGYAAAHNLYGQLLAAPLLRFDEARRHFNQARDLDPLSPWNDINLLGWWMHQGRPEETIREGEGARQRNPTVWTIACLMGHAQLLLGRANEAVAEFEQALQSVSPHRPSALLAPFGLANGLAGQRAKAINVLDELHQAAQTRYVSPFHLAIVQSGLRRMDEAFVLLDRALEERTPYLIFCVRSDGNSVALRRDQRWKVFGERLRELVKLPPGQCNPYS